MKQQDNKQVIVIEQKDPNTVYVPYYNPSVVYGGWPYPTYPPYYFPPPSYIAGGLLATGLAFGAGYALGSWASGGNYWIFSQLEQQQYQYQQSRKPTWRRQ